MSFEGDFTSIISWHVHGFWEVLERIIYRLTSDVTLETEEKFKDLKDQVFFVL